MENAAYIRSFNEIYADLTAEELIVLYKWVQTEDESLVRLAACNVCDTPVTGQQTISNNISHGYSTEAILKEIN